MAYCNYPATGSEIETEYPGILVYHVEGPTEDRQSDDPAPQKEAEENWAAKLARNRIRLRALQALRDRRSSRIVNHRLRTAVLTRRLLDPNPRDTRES